MEAKTRGGSTVALSKEKKGQYLEVLYPIKFIEISRANCKVHFEAPSSRVFYTYEAEPQPPSVAAYSLMVKKLDRLGRKILFVYGTASFGFAAIKKLFPTIDTRSFTFKRLAKEWNVNITTNLSRRIALEDAYVSRLDVIISLL